MNYIQTKIGIFITISSSSITTMIQGLRMKCLEKKKIKIKWPILWPYNMKKLLTDFWSIVHLLNIYSHHSTPCITILSTKFPHQFVYKKKDRLNFLSVIIHRGHLLLTLLFSEKWEKNMTKIVIFSPIIPFICLCVYFSLANALFVLVLTIHSRYSLLTQVHA